MDQGIQEGNVERVRAAFNLDETEPLLGFSFKPRFGLGESDFFEITKDVLNSGFHIVEPDTRKMLVDSERESYLEFARELPGVTEPSKSAFSLNLSGRTRDIEGIVSSLTRYRDRGWPIVMKIDGGLDGLSLMQRVKKVFPQSIITCYPLLKTILDGKVPKEFMNLALDFCGADVMYPSGRAVIAQEMRNYESEAQENISETYRRYTQFVKRGGFTPTVAGGITPGQLHIFYELYGPDVSFFLGGAVALHTEGPAAGAALCRNIIEHAMNFRVNHPDDDEKIPNVRPSLFNEVRDKFPIGDYQSPSYFFAHNEDIKKHSFAAKN
jgi:ribulose 1,5-bisphosphate carboxylase large subunit-like protein